MHITIQIITTAHVPQTKHQSKTSKQVLFMHSIKVDVLKTQNKNKKENSQLTFQ